MPDWFRWVILAILALTIILAVMKAVGVAMPIWAVAAPAFIAAAFFIAAVVLFFIMYLTVSPD